ncbi:MAG: class IIb bacteriocin, lactobin A/cerein 7B family [Gracilimonas sp.]|uniref:class IIb bacteriocin, lactobin A/cerein 7B family n=1 Tax=Gracilimonas sp. TaxID=1974203 RepID=UPI0037531D50|nr:class IIb bacteriocin, lactobin A/cerein 7B family [Gracilimonas sp.]
MNKINNVQSNYKAEELDHEEMKLINGGINPWVIGAVAWLANGVVQNWADIKKGISDAWEDFTFE